MGGTTARDSLDKGPQKCDPKIQLSIYWRYRSSSAMGWNSELWGSAVLPPVNDFGHIHHNSGHSEYKSCTYQDFCKCHRVSPQEGARRALYLVSFDTLRLYSIENYRPSQKFENTFWGQCCLPLRVPLCNLIGCLKTPLSSSSSYGLCSAGASQAEVFTWKRVF